MHIKHLIMDKNGQDTISKGAVLLWLTFTCLVFFWVLYAIAVYKGKTPQDAPATLFNVFIFLLGYVVFPKAEKLIKALNSKNDTIINNVVGKTDEKNK
jgi:hypothetical protein